MVQYLSVQQRFKRWIFANFYIGEFSMTWIRKGTKHVSLLWNVMSDVQRVKNSWYRRIFNDMDKKRDKTRLPTKLAIVYFTNFTKLNTPKAKPNAMTWIVVSTLSA